MRVRPSRSRVAALLTLVAALLIVPLALERVDASASSVRIAVIGDSISARYNDVAGSSQQGWWSFVGRRYDADVTVFAESGSGYVRPGRSCTGTRFGERLREVRNLRPHVVFVEGGRNDWSYCRDGTITRSSPERVERGVNLFLTRLESALPTTATIYVLGPPWGPKGSDEAAWVTQIVKTAARRHGLPFIETTDILTARRVVDGIHPNRAGSRALGARVIDAVGPQLPMPPAR